MTKKLTSEETKGYNKKIVVRLNGTDENPFETWGLKQNPFPQIGEYRYDPFDIMVNSLGGLPLKSREDIRKRLKGCSESFIQLCCDNFIKGDMVEFVVYWND